MTVLAVHECMTIRDYEKDGGCTLYQNAVRSEIVWKSELTSFEGHAGIRQEVIFFAVWRFHVIIQYCAKFLGTQSKCHLLVKFTILQHKLGRKSCSGLALGVVTTRSNYYGTMLSHWPNKLICYIWINSLTLSKNSLFESSRCRHGLLFNFFPKILNEV